ncbi:hypothetical protein AB1Y20_007447 [Prymnesium parvum]|uniref:Ion transport domain-containing protein n=1 Tax=Prymnesium parvum TaxID=97485 RepID=A0AB34IW39_PRYPA
MKNGVEHDHSIRFSDLHNMPRKPSWFCWRNRQRSPSPEQLNQRRFSPTDRPENESSDLVRREKRPAHLQSALSLPRGIMKSALRRCSYGTKRNTLHAPPQAEPVPSRSYWRSAQDKIVPRRRDDMAQFNRALRRCWIWRRDIPGEYSITLYRAPRIQHNRLLLKIVAAKMGTVYHITHSTRGQHTLAWTTPVTDPDGTVLPAGFVNLYQYPMVSFDGHLPVQVSGEKLLAIRWLIHMAAAEPQRTFYRRDASGAMPLHALAISNTPEALSLICELISLWPRMIPLVHGAGLYLGEHLFHILAVNRREDELCRMLHIAHLRLGRAQWLQLLSRTPTGIFFLGYPMSFYGSTLVGFCAAFGLKHAIHKIIMYDEVDKRSMDIRPRLTDHSHSCPVTGFMPLHCAVANGQLEMYDFLSGSNHHLVPMENELRIPSSLVADVTQRTVHGLRERWSMLTPLQLAAKLGDKRMTRHILRKRLTLNWKWGPLHSYRINLAEIDSVHGDAQVHSSMIELVADFTAGLNTQRLLLDDFMHGFLYALVRQKWMQFTRYIFYTMRLIELGYLLVLSVLCFLLKLAPSYRSTGLATVMLIFSILLMLVEVVLMVLWWRRDVIHGFESFYGFAHKLDRLKLWARAFSWRGKVLGFGSASAACALYLATASARARDPHTSTDDAPLYLMFGISSYFQGKAFISSICVSPSLPKMGVQMFVIDKMFHNDVTTYLYFLFGFTINYYLAMYISIPTNAQVGSHDLVKGSFVQFEMNNPATGFNAMLEQALIGIRFAPDWYATDATAFNSIEWLCFVFFYFIHLSFNVVCIILLMRLLMAMMTNTFRTVQESAQLEWRLLITRHVLRFELLGVALFSAHGALASRLMAGTKSEIDGKCYYHFLDVQTPLGVEKSVPMLLAQPAEHETLFEDSEGGSKHKPPKVAPLFLSQAAGRFQQIAKSNMKMSDGDRRHAMLAGASVGENLQLTAEMSQFRDEMCKEMNEIVRAHKESMNEQLLALTNLIKGLDRSPRKDYLAIASNPARAGRVVLSDDDPMAA